MEPEEQKMSIRKRRNLSKNRGQAARQREKTPEPGVMGIQGDIATSEDEDDQQPRNSREVEADCTYEEMKRLVEEQANAKDPVYDLDIDEVLEQRAQAASDRRRRSISPFAVQDLVKMQEAGRLERKGSFTDPTNKLLSANYVMSPKEEDATRRRSSLTIEPSRERKNSLTPPTPTSSSPKDKDSSPFFIPTTPKKLEEMVYPDEVKSKTVEERPKNLRTPITKETVFTFDDNDIKPTNKTVSPKPAETPVSTNKAVSPKLPDTTATAVNQQRAVETSTPTSKPTTLQKTPETPAPVVKPSIYPPEIPIQSGEVITKVVQVERTPSKKLLPENRPVVEIRERIVRTPSRKMSTDWQPLIPKQPPKPAKEETKLPPVKPARSKSASRFGNKTSESEMSEDQQNVAAGSRRKVMPTPRRFMKNRSPRANRSQSVARVEELKVVDKTGSEMTKTSKEIIELMQNRARSLSIPKDDPRLPQEYKRHTKKLQTPNKTPVSRTSRGGLMFKSLEGSFENAYKCGTRGVKRDFIENLWRGSHYLREDDWKSMARKKLHEFEDQLHTAYEAGVTSYSGQRSWNFMNSFVYCMTLVTTIGYGHIYPKTFYGRVATIVYAIIGIPLFLIVLADFGKLFTRIIKFFWAFIRRFYYTRSCRKVRRTAPVQEVMKGLNIMYDVVRRPSQIFSEEDMHVGEHGDHPAALEHLPSDVPPPLPPKPGQAIVKDTDEPDFDTPAPSVFEIDDEFNLPISVAIFILIVYIIIGAVVYNIWEEWGFFECFYFVFISMSTIGLGDFVPEHPIFMMCSILYLVFGLALTSMCINVVQEKLSDTFKKASAKLVNCPKNQFTVEAETNVSVRGADNARRGTFSREYASRNVQQVFGVK
ncbi:ion channel domain-containing protein [Phthorimaea operculella]|nr:ion channel domain-containing protein [Phthorimaea operculella]